MTVVRELIARSRNGDLESLGKLLDHYRPYLRILAARAIGIGLQKRLDQSDVVQITLLEAHQGFAGFRGESEAAFSKWLQQILKSNVANLLRDNRADKRNFEREVSFHQPEDEATLCWNELAADQSSPSQCLIRGEDALCLAIAMDKLPVDQREAIRLRHLENCSLQTIASQLERSPVAAAGLIKRGLAALRKALETNQQLQK
jgi:RNA polymerase sigma-70 factor (ECF subfamily)